MQEYFGLTTKTLLCMYLYLSAALMDEILYLTFLLCQLHFISTAATAMQIFLFSS